MKKNFLILILLLNYISIFGQDLSIDETLKYINDKLSANPFLSYQKTSNSYSISISKEGLLYINSYEDKVLVGVKEMPIKQIDFIKSFEKCPGGKYDDINFYCKLSEGTSNSAIGYFINENKCVKYIRKKENDVLYENYSFIMFSNVYTIGEGLCNAFRHLFKSVLSDPSYFASDPNDPFANKNQSKVTYNKTEENNGVISGDNTFCIVKIARDATETYHIPIVLNDVLKINFILDSGASEVSVSPDVALTLLKTGTITDLDWLPSKTYQFADGSTAKSSRFMIRTLKIGTFTLKNISASISNSISAPMLLGQNVLNKFGKISFDYKANTLTITK